MCVVATCGGSFLINKQMETTIEQELASKAAFEAELLANKDTKYPYKYGQLNGIIIMLEAFAQSAPECALKRQVLWAGKRAEEISRE